MMLLLLLLAAQVTPELTQHVNAGLKAKNAGDLPAAIVEFRRVVELAPNLAAAHVNLGAVYYDSKRYSDAIPALRKALELNPNLPGARVMLGASLLVQGYAGEAIPYLDNAEDLLGIALVEAGRERDAIDRLEAALAKRPNDANLLYYLSRAHAQLAKQIVDRLGTEFPDAARTRQLRGEAFAAAGNREAAIRNLKGALASRSDLQGVHLALGELALTSGDFDTAEREFRAETELVPGSAVAAYKLGLALMNHGDAKAALSELERADRLKPNMPETLLELGHAHAASGNSQQAEEALVRVLAQEKDSALAESAHFQLAQLYRKSGRTADADKEMDAFRALRAKRKP